MDEWRSPSRTDADETKSREALIAELRAVRAERDRLAGLRGLLEEEASRRIEAAIAPDAGLTRTRLGMLLTAARALMESRTLAAAARRVVEALALGGGWQAGLLWLVDEEDHVLRPVEGWQSPEVKHLADFIEASRPFAFKPGEGLPGRVWVLGHPLWVINVAAESGLPRATVVAQTGLHAAMAFPVRSGGRVVGVIELLGTEVRQPDREQIQLGEVLSGLIGQFVVRQQAEEALVRTNERLAWEAAHMKAVLGSALDAIVTMDHYGRITGFNPAAEAMFGYRRDEVIGLEMADVIIPERLREAHRRGLARYVATQEAHILGRRIEMPAVRRDGSEFPVELTITRIPQGGPPAFTGTMRDLTERRNAEAERQELAALRQTDQLKDQFLSILSHELRTPINAIMGFGSILDDELAGALSEKQHDYLRKMLNGADVLLALVNDLLDMSRIQAGKFTLSPAPVAIGPLVDEVVTSLAPLAEQKRQRVVVDLPADLPDVMADRQRLAQVLVNLVGNAIKFTPPGGAITVRGCLEPGWLRIEVADTGPGIADDDVPKLFHRFTQLDMSATRKAGGTGLGLSISKALVEAHGGAIGVESQPGHGATFWFTLPMRPTDG
jgi:PAS domain S-box-containing protein